MRSTQDSPVMWASGARWEPTDCLWLNSPLPLPPSIQTEPPGPPLSNTSCLHPSNPKSHGLKSCQGFYLRGPSMPGWAEDYKAWLRVSRSNPSTSYENKKSSPLRCQVNTVWWSISRLHFLEDCKSPIDLGNLYLGERIRQHSSVDQNCLQGSLAREPQRPLNDCFPANSLEINCPSYINCTRAGHLFWMENAPYFTPNGKAYPLKAKFCFPLNYHKMT